MYLLQIFDCNRFLNFENFIETSETANRNPFALAQGKRAVSECAQEHATPFRAAVLDIFVSFKNDEDRISTKEEYMTK